MKIWKLALAATLAAGTVAAYVYFPNPMESAARSEAQPSPEPPAADAPESDRPAPGEDST